MPIVTFAKPYKFAVGGTQVVEYKPGEHEVNDRCAEVAAQDGVLDKDAPIVDTPAEGEGAGEEEKAATPAQNKAAAPGRNKAK